MRQSISIGSLCPAAEGAWLVQIIQAMIKLLKGFNVWHDLQKRRHLQVLVLRAADMIHIDALPILLCSSF